MPSGLSTLLLARKDAISSMDLWSSAARAKAGAVRRRLSSRFWDTRHKCSTPASAAGHRPPAQPTTHPMGMQDHILQGQPPARCSSALFFTITWLDRFECFLPIHIQPQAGTPARGAQTGWGLLKYHHLWQPRKSPCSRKQTMSRHFCYLLRCMQRRSGRLRRQQPNCNSIDCIIHATHLP